MATNFDLAPDWLNSNASAFIPYNATDAVDLAFKKYGEHSIPLAAARDNYVIVVDDALDAATTLAPEMNH
jgi:hypothetical protein